MTLRKTVPETEPGRRLWCRWCRRWCRGGADGVGGGGTDSGGPQRRNAFHVKFQTPGII